jgi:hypothetical protein
MNENFACDFNFGGGAPPPYRGWAATFDRIIPLKSACFFARIRARFGDF